MKQRIIAGVSCYSWFETSCTCYKSFRSERLLPACEKCAVGSVLIGIIIIMVVLIIVIFSSRGHSLEQRRISHSLFEAILGLSSLVYLR